MQNYRNLQHSFRTAVAAVLPSVCICTVLLFTLCATCTAMPKAGYGKLSSALRALVSTENAAAQRHGAAHAMTQDNRRVCAFVQVKDADKAALADNGCKVLAQFGDIFIADVPLRSVGSMASDTRICRIEAERGNSLTLDSMSIFTNATPVYEGRQLPQAFTGRGVVVGIEDIGFDLTHPTFYSSDGNSYRIKRLWDQLSTDTVGSGMYVGAEYTSREALLNYGHSRDGITQLHGTHTLGIAAGSGAGTAYAGMAPESDICLVSNAVSGDEQYIDSADIYKYTYATDALGFKYIFDYADSQGKPCVISFSEGSSQDLRGDDMLYYEVLRRITGPGHIIVSSAGNNGVVRNYVGKPYGRTSAGTFCISAGNKFRVTTQSRGALSMRITLYNAGNCTSQSPHVSMQGGNTVVTFNTDEVTASPDSCLRDTFVVGGKTHIVSATAYLSCYDSSRLAMDIAVEGPKFLGFGSPLSMELVGEDSEADMYCMYGEMRGDKANAAIDDAESSHNINSPASAPAVICVGGTACRPVYKNLDGGTVAQSWGPSGERGNYSSVGPTFDGRMKPDVMAPGANIISALSSTFWDNHADDARENVVAKQTFNGREYRWFVTGGTSMSSPAVGGIIALWLQADPNLTPEDVLGIIARTSKPCGNYGSLPNNYCGYGMIDAYAGLLDVLKLNGIEGLSAQNPSAVRIAFTPEGHLIVKLNETARADFSISVFDTAGRKLRTFSLAAGAKRYETDLSALPSGIYAVQIDSAEKTESGSVLIRK